MEVLVRPTVGLPAKHRQPSLAWVANAVDTGVNPDGAQQKKQWLAGVNARICYGSARYHRELAMRWIEAELGQLLDLPASSSPGRNPRKIFLGSPIRPVGGGGVIPAFLSARCASPVGSTSLIVGFVGNLNSITIEEPYLA